MLWIPKSALHSGAWFPTDLTYYTTPRVLLCRGTETPREFYELILLSLNEFAAEQGPNEAVKNQTISDEVLDNKPIVFVPPDPRAQLFAELPQLVCNMAATFWRGMLISTSLNADQDLATIQEEATQFQVTCFHRGIEKVSILMCHRHWNSEQQSNFRRACEERGIPIVFMDIKMEDLRRPQIWCARADTRGFIRGIVTNIKNEVFRQVNARLESDAVEQDVMASQDDTVPNSTQRASTDNASAAKRRQVADSKLRKQRADCSLLLGNPVAALAHYGAALETYRQLGDVASQASCLECQAAALVLWVNSQSRILPETVSRSPDKSSPMHVTPNQTPSSVLYSASPTNTGGTGAFGGLPAVIDNLVKDTLVPKRGGTSILQQWWVDRSATQGSSLLASALQDFAHNFDQMGSTTERTKAERGRRSSIAPPPSTDSPHMVVMAAAATKLKEAATVYSRMRSGEGDLPGMISNLCSIALLISIDELTSAIEILNHLTEDAWHHKSPVITYIIMACAGCCWAARAPRRLASVLHHLCSRLVDTAASYEDSIQQEIWRIVYRSSLVLTPWLKLAPSVFLELNPETFLLTQPTPSLCESHSDPQCRNGLSLVQAALINLKRSLQVAQRFNNFSALQPSLSPLMPLGNETQAFLEHHYNETSLCSDHQGLAMRNWPALQATVLDRLRKSADRMGLSLHVLWYAYATLLYLHGAVDARSQTSAQRSMAAKEMQITPFARLAPITYTTEHSSGDQLASGLTSSASTKHTVPWLIPPGLVIVTPAGLSSQQATVGDWASSLGQLNYSSVSRRIKALKSLPELIAARYPNLSRRTRAKETVSPYCVLQYTCLGGLGNGAFPYVPLLLGLEPWTSRKLDLTNPAPRYAKSPSQHVSSEVLLKLPSSPNPAMGVSPEGTAKIDFNRSQESMNEKTFLYQPWRNRSSYRRRDDRQPVPVFWAQNDLHTVAVCVKNPLTIDILLDHCRVLTAGARADSQPLTVGLPPSGSQDVTFDSLIVPKETGRIYFIGLAYILSRVDTTQLLLWDNLPLLHTLQGVGPAGIHEHTEIYTLLETSAFASVDIVPPIPHLETRTMQTNFRIKPRIATPSAQMAPLITPLMPSGLSSYRESGKDRVLWENELFILNIRLDNNSALDVDDLRFCICDMDSELDLVHEIHDNHHIIFSHPMLDRCFRGLDANFDALISENSVLMHHKERLFGTVSPITKKISIRKKTKQDFYLQAWAKKEAARFMLRLIYSGERSAHCRVDSIPIKLQIRSCLKISSAAFFSNTSLHLHQAFVDDQFYSHSTQLLFEKIMGNVNNSAEQGSRSSSFLKSQAVTSTGADMANAKVGNSLVCELMFDDPFSLMLIEISNDADRQFELSAKLTEHWTKIVPFELPFEGRPIKICKETKVIAANEFHSRWVIYIERFIPPSSIEQVAHIFQNPQILISSLLDITWRCSADNSQGYLSLHDTYERIKNEALLQRNEIENRELSRHSLAAWKPLLLPEIQLELQIRDHHYYDHEQERYLMSLMDHFTIEVRVRLLYQSSHFGDGYKIALFLNSSETHEALNRFIISGSLESFHSENLGHSNELVRPLHSTTFLPIAIGTTNFHALFATADNCRIWLHSKPLVVSVK